MSFLQFVEWAVFYQAEPFGEMRSDLRAGIVAAKIHNTHIVRASDAVNPTDMMPKFDVTRTARRNRPMMSVDKWQEVKQIARSMTGKAGRRVWDHVPELEHEQPDPEIGTMHHANAIQLAATQPAATQPVAPSSRVPADMPILQFPD